LSDRTLAESAFSHIINAPIGRVDIADWLFHLPSAEYQRCCPPAHIAAGVSTTDDGIPMSINVEVIGDSVMIQKYVGEITDADHCRMVSISDVFSPLGRTTSHVVWDLSVEPLDDQSCEFINHVKVTATDEFLASSTSTACLSSGPPPLTRKPALRTTRRRRRCMPNRTPRARET
jgi:hypothetical protein